VGAKREREESPKPLTAKAQKAALRRRREVLDALLKVLRGY
jgi:hypothetical protein